MEGLVVLEVEDELVFLVIVIGVFEVIKELMGVIVVVVVGFFVLFEGDGIVDKL